MLKNILLSLVLLLAFAPIYAKIGIIESSNSLKISVSAADYRMNDGKFVIKNDRANVIQFDSLNEAYRFFVASPISSIAPNISELIESPFSSGKASHSSDYIINANNLGYKSGAYIFSIDIIPIKSNTSSSTVLSDFELNIDFGEHINYVKSTISKPINFYLPIANNNQAQYLATISHKDRNNKILSNDESFFKSGVKYIKLKTSRDGIAFITTDSILKLVPEWSGKSKSNFRLFNDSLETGIYFSSSAATTLGAGDTLFFFGKRPAGALSYYDFVAPYNAFFLYYDSAIGGIVNKEIAATSGASEIEFVSRKIHYEKDSIYLAVDKSEWDIVAGESWYWKKLNYHSPNKFTFSPILAKSDGVDTIRAHSFGGAETDYNYNHNTALIFNGDTLKTTMKNGYTAINQSSVVIGSGLAKIDIVELGVPECRDSSGYADDIYVDYFDVQGSFEPIAENSKFDFSYNATAQDSKILAKNFSNSNIIAIDTINNEFARIAGASGDFAMATAKKNASYISLKLNDSTIISEISNKIAVAFVDANNIISAQTFSSYSSELVAFINTIPSGAFTAVACNLASSPTSAFLSAISPIIGALPSDIADSAWTAIGKSGVSKTEYKANLASVSNFIVKSNGTKFQAEIPLKANRARYIFASDISSAERASAELVNNFNLRSADNSAEYLIIYHPKFKSAADSLAKYRSAKNNISVRAINVEDIYNDFNGGVKSHEGIKNFLKYVMKNWTARPAQWVVLMGGACYDSRKLSSTTTNEDYIPTYGNPATDYWYSVLDSNSFLPSFIIARMAFRDSIEAGIYINKIKEFERSKADKWQKNFLYLTGGLKDSQRIEFRNDAITYSLPLIITPLCIDTTIITKSDDIIVGGNDAKAIKDKINSGVFWINFAGHGSPTVIDMDGWNAKFLNNAGKYPLLTSFSCRTGEFAINTGRCRTDEYMIQENAGCIAAIGSTSLADIAINNATLGSFINALTAPSMKKREFGDLLYYAKLANVGSYFGTSALYQYNLLGDPLCKFAIDTTVNYYLLDNDITVKNSAGESEIFEDDSTAYISGFARNLGLSADTDSRILLIRTYGGTSDSLYYDISNDCGGQSFDFLLPIAGKLGANSIRIIVDPDRTLGDADYSNNEYDFSLFVRQRAPLALEPLANWNVCIGAPRFRFINPKFDTIIYADKFRILDGASEIYASKPSEITTKPEYIDFTPSALSLAPNKNYTLKIIRSNRSDASDSTVSFLPFYADTPKIQGSATQKMFGANLSAGAFENTSFVANKIQLANTDKAFSIRSCTGGVRDGINRGAKDIYIVFDGHTIDSSWSNRGINLAIVDKRTGEYRKKIFDTWQYDTTARDFIYFMQDSVKDDEYILLGSCDYSFKGFEDNTDSNSIYSLKSLRKILRQYGGSRVDSIKGYSSYCLAGYKGASSNEAFEDFHWSGDTSSISGTFPLYNLNGSFATQTIGPARAWKQIKFDRNSAVGIISMDVYGIDNSGGLSMLASSNGESYDASKIDASLYPYLSLNFNFSRDSISQNPALTSYACEYAPLSELAIIKDSTGFANSSIFRGDTAQYALTVKNLSLRVPSLITSANLYESGNKIIADSLPALALDESVSLKIPLISDYLANSRAISAIIDNEQKYLELYRFNNTNESAFSFSEDTTAPRLKIYFDGVLTKDGDQVSPYPLIKVELLDDSKINFLASDSTNFTFRINGKIVKRDSTSYYKFTAVNGDSIKATVEFIWKDSLEIDENTLIAIGADKSGNKDTVKLNVVVSANTQFGDYTIFPNPASDEITVKTTFKSFVKSAPAKVEIFDLSGRIINSENIALAVGENNITLKLKDTNGSELSCGVYIIRIKSNGEYYFDPIYDKFVVIR